MRVAATSVCIKIVGVDCAAFKAPATDMVIGIIKTLSPKWINAIIRNIENFFMVRNQTSLNSLLVEWLIR